MADFTVKRFLSGSEVHDFFFPQSAAIFAITVVELVLIVYVLYLMKKMRFWRKPYEVLVLTNMVMNLLSRLATLFTIPLANRGFSDNTLFYIGIWTIFTRRVLSCFSSSCNAGIMYYFLRLNRSLIGDPRTTVVENGFWAYVFVAVLSVMIFVFYLTRTLLVDIVYMFEYLGFAATYSEEWMNDLSHGFIASSYGIPIIFGFAFITKARKYFFSFNIISDVSKHLAILTIFWIIFQTPLAVVYFITIVRTIEWKAASAFFNLTELQPLADCFIVLKLGLWKKASRSKVRGSRFSRTTFFLNKQKHPEHPDDDDGSFDVLVGLQEDPTRCCLTTSLDLLQSCYKHILSFKAYSSAGEGQKLYRVGRKQFYLENEFHEAYRIWEMEGGDDRSCAALTVSGEGQIEEWEEVLRFYAWPKEYELKPENTVEMRVYMHETEYLRTWSHTTGTYFVVHNNIEQLHDFQVGSWTYSLSFWVELSELDATGAEMKMHELPNILESAREIALVPSLCNPPIEYTPIQETPIEKSPIEETPIGFCSPPNDQKNDSAMENDPPQIVSPSNDQKNDSEIEKTAPRIVSLSTEVAPFKISSPSTMELGQQISVGNIGYDSVSLRDPDEPPM